MAIDLVTGYRGNNHITAEQWADLNRGIVGSGAILNVGSKMAVSIQTANQITVSDGVAVFDGREFYIEHGDSVNVTIASGTQNKMRNDIVYIEYAQDAVSGVETAAIKVAEGTPVTSNPSDPEINDADIRDGVLLSQKKLCRVRIVNTAIDGIDMLVDVIDAIPEIMEKINNLSEGKSNTEHMHDDRYYTETEVNNLLANKVSKSGDTINGNVQVNGVIRCSEDKVAIWSDNEGGNLSFTGGDGTKWKIDAYDGHARFFNYTDNYPGIVINKNGTLYCNFGLSVHNYADFYNGANFQNNNVTGIQALYFMQGTSGHITNYNNQQMYFAASSETNYEAFLGVRENDWCFCPNVNGMLKLGSPNYKWGPIYSTTSTITTSDKNQKSNISPLTEQHIKFFMKLQPVSYRFIDGTSGRTHIGFVSQDVELAMIECGLSDLDFAGFCKDQKYETVSKTVEVENPETGETELKEAYEYVPIEGEYIYSLRYEEFVALNAYVTQYLYSELSSMKETLDALMKKVDALEKE